MIAEPETKRQALYQENRYTIPVILMKKAARQNALFARISFRLIFPLLLLIFAFTGVQLTNQLSFLNRIYEIQSRISLQGMIEALNQTLSDPASFENPFLMKANLQKAKEANNVSDLLVLDPLTREALYSDTEGGFTQEDLVAMEQSLLDKKEGKPPLFLIDKEAQKLNAFVPLTSPVKEKIYIAKMSFPLGNLKLALKKSTGALLAILILTLLAGVLIAAGLSSSIVKPIQSLNQATREILRGNLGQKVAIYTGDEIQELAETFNRMSVALKEMKERAEDANPLTQLPGNHGIYHETQRRIYEKQKFVFFHIDLDRFKIFNDRYGLARGDEVIKKTAKLLREAINEKGAADDFLGHQGGDDFVIIVKPMRAQAVAEAVIQKFDELIKGFYRKDDYERGFILEHDRRAAPGSPESMVKFPLMAISLAGVTNAKRDFTDYFDLLARAVEVKKKVKSISGSCHFIQE